MLALAGIDAAAPMIRGSRVNEQDATQFSTFWASDLLLVKHLGFDVVRLGVPWPLVEPEQGVYEWHLLDGILQLCADIGLTVWYNLTHFAWPMWLGAEPLRNPQLADHLARLGKMIMDRYPAIPVLSPCVEISTEIQFCYTRAHWSPHYRDHQEAGYLVRRLYAVWDEVAATIQAAGRKTMLVECADQLVVFHRVQHIDLLGLNWYPAYEYTMMHPFEQWSQAWHQTFPTTPLYLTEYGMPGSVAKRLHHIQTEFGPAFQKVQHCYTGASWYPTLDNRWWGSCLEDQDATIEGDNAGFVDMQMDHSGRLQRVPRRELVAAWFDVVHREAPVQIAA